MLYKLLNFLLEIHSSVPGEGGSSEEFPAERLPHSAATSSVCELRQSTLSTSTPQQMSHGMTSLFSEVSPFLLFHLFVMTQQDRQTECVPLNLEDLVLMFLSFWMCFQKTF